MAATPLPDLIAALVAEVAVRKAQHRPNLRPEELLDDVAETVHLTLAVYDPELFGRYLREMQAQTPALAQPAPAEPGCPECGVVGEDFDAVNELTFIGGESGFEVGTRCGQCGFFQPSGSQTFASAQEAEETLPGRIGCTV